nr:hypothetical protein [Mucilaginibacter sp. X5P1]
MEFKFEVINDNFRVEIPYPLSAAGEERVVKRSDDRVSRRSASKFRVRDDKGLARRRRAEAKRSPEQPGRRQRPNDQNPNLKN